VKFKKSSQTLWYFLLCILFLTACDQQQTNFRPLPANAVIVAFGDSLTFGTGATPETNYPNNLEKIISHQVINAGVPGEETSGGLARIKQVLDDNNPQLVILCLGGNDFLHKKSLDQAKQNLKSIIQIIKASGAQVLLIGVPTVNINLAVPDLYNELSEEMNVPVDNNILPVLLGEPEYKSDYIHLNGAGYKIFAQDVADFLKARGAI
jgi:acyl-CoA thioesterase-1